MNNTLTTQNDNSGYIAVVGGVNIDIGGISTDKLVKGDSNPGLISINLGGVGRNIAHNLSLLRCPVKLITAIGDDTNAMLIKTSCRKLNIDISESYTAKGEASSTYLFINDSDGDMALAVNDMRICNRLTPDFFKEKLDVLNGARLVVLDTNIPKESIEFIADNVKVPIFADAVSTVKVMKLKSAIGRLHSIKANKIEAQALSGIEISDDASLKAAAALLIGMGAERVFISLGEEGMAAATRDDFIKIASDKVRPVSTTGAGDAVTAALALAYCENLSLEDSLKCANRAARITLEAESAVSERLRRELLLPSVYRYEHLWSVL